MREAFINELEAIVDKLDEACYHSQVHLIERRKNSKRIGLYDRNKQKYIKVRRLIHEYIEYIPGFLDEDVSNWMMELIDWYAEYRMNIIFEKMKERS